MLLFVLLGAALVGTLLMGVLPYFRDFAFRNDYAFVYDGCRAMWAGGGGPYRQGFNVYPPATMEVFYPLAILPVFASSAIVAVLSLVAFLVAIARLVSVLPEGERLNRRVFFLAVALLWAPMLAGLHSNNVSILAIAMVLIVAARPSGKSSWADPLMVGLSIAIKPQLGGLYLLFWALRGRWKDFGISTGVVALLTLLALAKIAHVEPAWVADYRHSQILFNSPGSWADVSYAATRRYVLLNFQAALYPFARSVSLSRWLGAGVGLALIGVWAMIDHAARSRRNELLGLAALLPITLTMVFQQYYNAALLVLCLAAALTLRRTRASIAATILLASYVVRPAPLYQRLPPRFLDGGVHSALWNSFGVAFSAWQAMLVSVVMLWLYWRESASASR